MSPESVRVPGVGRHPSLPPHFLPSVGVRLSSGVGTPHLRVSRELPSLTPRSLVWVSLTRPPMSDSCTDSKWCRSQRKRTTNKRGLLNPFLVTNSQDLYTGVWTSLHKGKVPGRQGGSSTREGWRWGGGNFVLFCSVCLNFITSPSQTFFLFYPRQG